MLSTFHFSFFTIFILNGKVCNLKNCFLFLELNNELYLSVVFYVMNLLCLISRYNKLLIIIFIKMVRLNALKLYVAK